MRCGLVQLCSGDDPAVNLAKTRAAIGAAAEEGAGFVLTPEITNLVSADRALQRRLLHREPGDPSLAGLREEAAKRGIWLLIGSLALKTGDSDGRFANRSFLIAPDGDIAARYDKIHMFDVALGPGEEVSESRAYRPGTRAVIAETPFARIGLTICYDLRFPALYRRLAGAGAQMLTVPSAFSRITGPAHWEPLLRARAIETGAYVLAPAQCGENAPGRASHGHSLAISPWGEVLGDGGAAPGTVLVDFDPAEVDHARTRIPSLAQSRDFEGPHVR